MDSFRDGDEDADTYVQAETKRRVRKGTRSCWECKRRKMKCTLDPLNDASVCNGCRRRGSKCVSQEYPEASSLTTYTDTTLDGGTPTTPGEGGGRTDGIVTSALANSESSRSLDFDHVRVCDSGISATAAPASRGKYERLSQLLHRSLPSREDTERICNASRHPFVPVLAHEILTVPYTTLHQNGLKTPYSLLDTPKSNQHPVLLARHMLQIAVFLQHLHPEIHEEMKGLSESPRAIRKRLADLAISLVTTNNELLGSIEGLECVMIESMYEANAGDLRRSWLAGRRAISIAQLMDLDRPSSQAQYKVLDSKTEYHPQLMWFRIIFLDRHLSLMLGLPQGPLDCSMASDAMLADDTPTGRLERRQCVLASRILERNESKRASDDFALTLTLDAELQKAARSLPSRWWLAPNLDNVASTDSKALFWDTRRLFAQVLHYNLLNQLHLPYMLRSSSASEHKYEYSGITCVNASREVLSRFITLRSFDRIAYSWSCRIVDFLALMAAMTLLLAHLDSQRSSDPQNLLAHQYLTDRAMIEQAQEHMEEVNRLNSDALSTQSADLLRRLLAIEVEIGDGNPRCARRVSVQEAGTETALSGQDNDAVLKVHIPYFGIIKIAREGICKEVPKPQATPATTSRPSQSRVVDGSSTASTETLYTEPQMRLSGLTRPSEVQNVEVTVPIDRGYGYVESDSIMSDSYAKTQVPTETPPIPATAANGTATYIAPQLQNALFSSLRQYADYPELAAGGEDWAFQGVDMAFFESLMSSSGNEGYGVAE
ncbi:MAG: hypothetical protein Q9165_008813 [Trypethelium subeluteriae]